MALPEYPFMDIEDYLLLERHSHNARYEYFDGELRMLAGGSLAYSLIKTNLTSIIHGLLRGSSCTIYDSDARVKLSASRYVYPDATISCDPRDQEQDEEIRYPRVIVEVLSPTTEPIDRGRNFTYYRECPTLQEYVMIDTRSMHIEVYRREERGWMLYTFGPQSEIELQGINIRFSIEDMYERIKL